MGKTKNIWNELYQAAAALRDANPWKMLNAQDLMGVESPEINEIFFCAFAESGEEENFFKGLTAYQGAAGLEFYQRIAQDNVDMLHMLWAQQGFQVQFVSRKELDDATYQKIKESGIVCRGKTAWPIFNTFTSGRAEVTVSEEQGDVILTVLKQLLQIVEEMKKSKSKDLLGNVQQDCRYLVRKKSGRTWKNTYEYAPAVTAPAPLGWTKEEMKECNKPLGTQTWELDGFYWPSLPQETAEGIRLPFIWAIADHSKGIPIGMEISYESDGWQEGKPFLIKQLSQFSELPARIAVKRPELFLWLRDALKELGIQTLLYQEIPGMIRVREELRRAEDDMLAETVN